MQLSVVRLSVPSIDSSNGSGDLLLRVIVCSGYRVIAAGAVL